MPSDMYTFGTQVSFTDPACGSGLLLPSWQPTCKMHGIYVSMSALQYMNVVDKHAENNTCFCSQPVGWSPWPGLVQKHRFMRQQNR